MIFWIVAPYGILAVILLLTGTDCHDDEGSMFL
jgi:hypothetical protein